MRKKGTGPRKTHRKFRLIDEIINCDSSLINLGDIYSNHSFAKSKYNGIYYIFEVTSGYVVGQGKSLNFAINTSKEYLRGTKGNFGMIVEHFNLK
jgi:hypothetical protein